MKKDFNTYFDEICLEKKKEKMRKKKVWEKNVQSHIVYMDENGNIYKKDKHAKGNKYLFPLKIFLCSLILALCIYIIYELVPLFVLLTN